MMRSKTVVSMATASAGLLAAGSAAAITPDEILAIQAGPVLIRPQLSVSEVYDDNIFYSQELQPGQTEYDLITYVSPGLKVSLGRPEENYLSLGYSFDQRFYVENDNLDTGDHNLTTAVRLKGKRFKLEGSDRIGFLSSIYGGSSMFVGLVDRMVFNDNYTLTYQISEKTSVYGEVLYYAYDWEDADSFLDWRQGSSFYDYNVLQGTLGFGYQAFPKTTLFGEVYYGQAASTPSFEPDPDDPLAPAKSALTPSPTEFIGGFVGARGTFTPKLTGTAKLGYEYRHSFAGDVVASTPVGDLALTYQFNEKTSSSLSYSRRNIPAVDSRSTYTADAITAWVSRAFGSRGKLKGTLGAGYTFYDYGDQYAIGSDSRQDAYVNLYTQLAYSVQQWMQISLRYDYNNLDSNVAIDYDVNRITLRIALGY